MIFDSIIDSCYSRREYPALNSLMIHWAKTKPFAGMNLLVATPVFRNTLLEYRALMAGGAKLWVGRDTVPFDSKIVEMLRGWGIPVLDAAQAMEQEHTQAFDLVLDCAGQFAGLSPKLGFVELTRSGVPLYQNSLKPVYVADSGIVKRIETSLGTGEGYVRAMKELGYGDFEGKSCVVFGSGKVGSGIVLQLLREDACVQVVTDVTLGGNPFLDANGVSVTDCRDIAAVVSLVARADYVVTATGLKGALDNPELATALVESRALLANMGVEDEFGPGVPLERVLAEKSPLNFILEEPTHLKYIDASLALHAALGEQLVREISAAGVGSAGDPKSIWSGTRNPPEELEREILSVTMQDGLIGAEICEMLGGLPSEN